MNTPRPNVRRNAPVTDFEGLCIQRARLSVSRAANLSRLALLHFYIGFFKGAGLSDSRAESLAEFVVTEPEPSIFKAVAEEQFTKMPNGELVQDGSSMSWKPGEWPEFFVLERAREHGGRKIMMRKGAARYVKVNGAHEFAGHAYISQLEDSKPHSIVAFILND